MARGKPLKIKRESALFREKGTTTHRTNKGWGPPLIILLLIVQPWVYAGPLDPMLLCYRSRLSLLQGPDKWRFVMSHFSESKIYKLFIDKNRLLNPEDKEKDEVLKGHPELIFDVQEPGYYLGMKKAYEWMATQIGQPNNLNLLVLLHDAAVGLVPGLSTGIAEFGSWGYSIGEGKQCRKDESLTELTQAGVIHYPEWFEEEFEDVPLREVSQGLEIANRLSFIYLSKFLAPGTTFISQSSGNPHEVELRLEPYFNYYHKNISSLKTFEGKISAIAELLRTLEVYHFFPDGNQRTIAFLMLDKLLVENNMPPAILEDPTLFDGYAPVEMMKDGIKTGINNFLQESTEFHASLLSSCPKLEDDPRYLMEGVFEYKPYFKTHSKTSWANYLKEIFKGERNLPSEDFPSTESENFYHLSRIVKEILHKHGVLSLPGPTKNGKLGFNLGMALQIAAELESEEAFRRLYTLITPDNQKSLPYRYLILSLINNGTLNEFLPQLLKISQINSDRNGEFTIAAIKSENGEALKALINAKIIATPQVEGHKFIDPLLVAAATDDLPQEIVDLLLKHPSRLENKTYETMRILTLALNHQNFYLMRRLILSGLPISEKDLKLARENEFPKDLLALMKKVSKKSPL